MLGESSSGSAAPPAAPPAAPCSCGAWAMRSSCSPSTTEWLQLAAWKRRGEINRMDQIPESFPTTERFEANKLPICSRLIAVNANRLTFHKLNTIWWRGSAALWAYTDKSTGHLLDLDNEWEEKINKWINTLGKCLIQHGRRFALYPSQLSETQGRSQGTCFSVSSPMQKQSFYCKILQNPEWLRDFLINSGSCLYALIL